MKRQETQCVQTTGVPGGRWVEHIEPSYVFSKGRILQTTKQRGASACIIWGTEYSEYILNQKSKGKI